jgi:hypothetical protein
MHNIYIIIITYIIYFFYYIYKGDLEDDPNELIQGELDLEVDDTFGDEIESFGDFDPSSLPDFLNSKADNNYDIVGQTNIPSTKHPKGESMDTNKWNVTPPFITPPTHTRGPPAVQQRSVPLIDRTQRTSTIENSDIKETPFPLPKSSIVMSSSRYISIFLSMYPSIYLILFYSLHHPEVIPINHLYLAT